MAWCFQSGSCVSIVENLGRKELYFGEPGSSFGPECLDKWVKKNQDIILNRARGSRGYLQINSIFNENVWLYYNVGLSSLQRIIWMEIEGGSGGV